MVIWSCNLSHEKSLSTLISIVKEHSGKKGLHFNVKKTNILDVKECLEPTKVNPLDPGSLY